MNLDQKLIRTADIASAYLKRNIIKARDIAALLSLVHKSLSQIEGPAASPAPTKQEAAITIKKSITPGYLVCLEDGRRVKMLKRYLRTKYSMTPHEYRLKWGLPLDYPMAAPNYTAARSKHALSVGFGKRSGRGRPEALTSNTGPAEAPPIDFELTA